LLITRAARKRDIWIRRSRGAGASSRGVLLFQAVLYNLRERPTGARRLLTIKQCHFSRSAHCSGSSALRHWREAELHGVSLKDGRSISPAAPAAKVRVSPATRTCALTQETIFLKKGAWPHNWPALSQEGGRGGCDRCITQLVRISPEVCPFWGNATPVANSLRGSRSQPCRCAERRIIPPPRAVSASLTRNMRAPAASRS